MKLKFFKSTTLALIIAGPISVMAAEPLYHSEEVTNPIEAIVKIPVTGVKVAAGAAALPLMFVGEIGNISNKAGEALWNHASGSNNESKQPSRSSKTN